MTHFPQPDLRDSSSPEQASPAQSVPKRRSSRVSIAASCAVVWLGWLILVAWGDRWLTVVEGWVMAVTMMAGSFIAGSTSVGGGAVAFPAMTLIMAIPPAVARDFSLMIQAVGMSSAAATILYTGTKVEWKALRWGSLGGALGVVAGLELLAWRVPPVYTKLFFTSLWLAFAFALLLVNRFRDREVREHIAGSGWRPAGLLLATGCLGGLISSLTGSGLDTALFAILVLGFGLCEKVATPTSVILMAGNACAGFAWKELAGPGMSEQAWNYWWAAVPVVVLGAPLGAWFIRGRSREFIVRLLVAAIVLQFLAAMWILPLNGARVGFCLTVFLFGLVLFRLTAWFGVEGHSKAAGVRAPAEAGGRGQS